MHSNQGGISHHAFLICRLPVAYRSPFFGIRDPDERGNAPEHADDDDNVDHQWSGKRRKLRLLIGMKLCVLMQHAAQEDGDERLVTM